MLGLLSIDIYICVCVFKLCVKGFSILCMISKTPLFLGGGKGDQSGLRGVGVGFFFFTLF